MKMARRWLLTLLFLTFAIATGFAQPADEDPVVAAARRRQEAVKTLVVELKETMTRKEGTLPKGAVQRYGVIREHHYRYVIDGVKIRCELDMTEPNPPHEPICVRRTAVFDGVLAKQLLGNPFHPGEISALITNRDAEDFIPVPLPIAMTYRGLNPKKNRERFDRFTRTAGEEVIDDVECVEYLRETKDWKYFCWFDLGKDFVLRRSAVRRDRGFVFQLDIHYREEPGIGWVPTGWTQDGAQVMEVEVLKIEFNTPIPAETFDIVFPPGISVSDQRDDKVYVVEPNGSWRVTHEHQRPIGDVTRPPWYIRNRWLSYALIAAVGVLAALIFAAKALIRKRAAVSES
jgi:hypothetical protein